MRALQKILWVSLLAACSGKATETRVAADPASMTGSQPSSAEVPIDADDAVWGNALAPVTMVVFTDLQCPFCAEGHEVLAKLQKRFGPERLRVVVKHVPLSAHAGAVPAARVAQAVLELGGSAKFFEYLERAFAHQEQVASGGAVELAVPLGINLTELAARAGSARIGQEILADVALAERLSVTALPHVRINGRGFTGVRPIETLTLAIDSELADVRRLTTEGVAPTRIYSLRVRQNVNVPEPD